MGGGRTEDQQEHATVVIQEETVASVYFLEMGSSGLSLQSAGL